MRSIIGFYWLFRPFSNTVVYGREGSTDCQDLDCIAFIVNRERRVIFGERVTLRRVRLFGGRCGLDFGEALPGRGRYFEPS